MLATAPASASELGRPGGRVLALGRRAWRALVEYRARAFGAPELVDGGRFAQDVVERLAEEAVFAEAVYDATVFSDDLKPRTRGVTVRRLRYAPVRWARRAFGLDASRATAGVQAAVELLGSEDVALLRELKVSKAGAGWVLSSERTRLRALALPAGQRCRKCGTRYDFRSQQPCPRCVKVSTAPWDDRPPGFFGEEYVAPLRERVKLLAEEHSVQVPGDERKHAELAFESDDAPLNVPRHHGHRLFLGQVPLRSATRTLTLCRRPNGALTDCATGTSGNARPAGRCSAEGPADSGGNATVGRRSSRVGL